MKQIRNIATSLRQILPKSVNSTEIVATAEPSFAAVGVSQTVLKNLHLLNITTPTAFQTSFIPTLISHSDLILKDTTGSGKTMGLVIALLSKKHPSLLTRWATAEPLDTFTPLEGSNTSNTVKNDSSPASFGDDTIEFKARRMAKRKYTTTLFMVPTRELAVQITEWIRILSFGKSQLNTSGLVQCIISGVDKQEQINLISNTMPSIIVGTPVRLLELYNEGFIDTSRLQLAIVDEVDRIIDAASRYHNPKSKKVHLLAGHALLGKIFKERTQITNEMAGKLSTIQKGRSRASKSSKIDSALVIDASKSRKLQIVASSATINNPIRNLLKQNWMKTPIILDPNGPHQTPHMSHYCYILNSTGNARRLLPEPILSKEELDKRKQESADFYGPIIDDSEGVSSHKKKRGQVDPSLMTLPPAVPDDDDSALETVVNIIKEHRIKKAFVFANSSTSITALITHLSSFGIKADKLFNLISYADSTTNFTPDSAVPFNKFNSGEVDVIVCTEHEARGLDLPAMECVFILGLASSPASYLHMAGRSTRFGKKGMCVSVLGGERYVNRFQNMMRLMRLQLE